jgi:predicted CopG family antitoxin
MRRVILSNFKPTGMTDTTIRISEDLADELYERKSRGESYEDVIWQLIEKEGQNGSTDE